MMTDLTLSKKEAKEEAGLPYDAAENLPKFPYGTCLYLDSETLAKLGVSVDVKVGTQVTIQAVAIVNGTSQRQNQKGETYSSMDLQITSMEVSGLPKTTAEVAKRLYGADEGGTDA